MKKSLPILLLVALAGFQCTKDEVKPDCGCDSRAAIKELIGVNATLQKQDQDLSGGDFYILPDDSEANDGYLFHGLMSCDSNTFSNEDFQDGTRIKISGVIRPICRPQTKSMPGVVACYRFVTARIDIKKVELIEGDE